jgi:DTW domain-containing protein YfiP
MRCRVCSNRLLRSTRPFLARGGPKGALRRLPFAAQPLPVRAPAGTCHARGHLLIMHEHEALLSKPPAG